MWLGVGNETCFVTSTSPVSTYENRICPAFERTGTLSLIPSVAKLMLSYSWTSTPEKPGIRPAVGWSCARAGEEMSRMKAVKKGSAPTRIGPPVSVSAGRLGEDGGTRRDGPAGSDPVGMGRLAGWATLYMVRTRESTTIWRSGGGKERKLETRKLKLES